MGERGVAMVAVGTGERVGGREGRSWEEGSLLCRLWLQKKKSAIIKKISRH